MIAAREAATAAAPPRRAAPSPFGAGVSADRLPALRLAFERAATQLGEIVRQMAGTPARFSVAEIGTGQPGEIVDSYGAGAILAFLDVPEWEARITAGFDRGFVYALAETLFGGNGTEPAFADVRPFTSVETRLARMMFEQVAGALKGAFAPVAKASFRLERVEPRLDFVVLDRRGEQAVVAKLRFEAIERGGEMFLILPQAALKALRPQPGRERGRDAADPSWARKIESEVQRTEVPVRAVIEEPNFSLGDIAGLRVGQVLALQATPDSQVKLESSGQALFWCSLGQADGRYVVRIEEPISAEQEFMNDILSR